MDGTSDLTPTAILFMPNSVISDLVFHDGVD
jgi:hypothetical protein